MTDGQGGAPQFFNPLKRESVRDFPPRKSWLFGVICLCWIGFGLLGRDPWKPEEVVLVSVVKQMADGGLSGIPLLLGEAYVPRPPLYLWLAALSAKLWQPLLPVHEGARMLNAVLLAAGFAFVFFVVKSKHGPRIGWLSVLLMVGTAGFVIRSHLLLFAVPAFTGTAMLLWGMNLLRRRSLAGGVAAGTAIGFLFMAAGPSVAVAAAAAVLLACSRREWRRYFTAYMTLAVFSLPWLLIWPLFLRDASPQLFMHWWTPPTVAAIPGRAADLLRIAAWALFPLLPLVAVAWWRYRESYRRDELVFLCLCMTGLMAAVFLWVGGGEEELFVMIPPLAIAAALGLPRLPDDYASVLDWFAVTVIGVCGVGALWLFWFCLQSGRPAAWVEYAESLNPGFAMAATPIAAVAVAAAVTVLWVLLAINFGRSNERAIVNWSCGVTVAWAVFNLLWVDYVDSGKSYRPMARAVAAVAECVDGRDVSRQTLAQLDYFGVRIDAQCPFVFTSLPSDETLLWRGGRAATEKYGVYRRAE